ncbi:Wax ester synthase/diacylglycerol acyltransferase 5 (WS/DGAT 5) (Diacylglycerol O-acyltransferase WSD5) (Long-chain-alcohol O-fatty-acyltransferase WSD5) [Durusdinium trenchii]|uniref:Wax ester synthase/diacylglycerol acyltransferase 5 (WS/DGAT 5) (Diacylglycerol O-acyltransferase WSD5) (Long-chain-alcohol O-fatty-acyltransferase WSD5) n=1 Tax=Durusdinium trenchii TaxID=1381693 RepID=A0ABP0HRP3_9DINO
MVAAAAPEGNLPTVPGAKPGKTRRASIMTRILAGLSKESDTKATWVVGILTLASNPGLEALKEGVGMKLLEMPRFRSVAKTPMGRRMYWKELSVSDMDMEYHFRERPDIKTQAQLVDFVGDPWADSPPDLDKPLWVTTLIPEMEDGRAVLVTNISHTIADGVSSIEVLFRLLADAENPAEMAKARPPPKRKQKTFGPINRALLFLSGVKEGLFLILGKPDGPSSLRPKGSLAPTKKICAFADPIDIDRVKAVKLKMENATLNDVMITVLTMCIKAFVDEQDDQKVRRGAKFRAQFPVNLRKKGQDVFKDGSPGNTWGYGYTRMFLSDKAHADGPVALAWKVKRNFDKVKEKPTPIVSKWVAAAIIPLLPQKFFNKIVLDGLGQKSTAQLSSVASATKRVKLVGTSVEIEDMNFVLHSPLLSYLGLISYAGKVHVIVNLDKKVGVDPQEIVKHWAPSFEKLEAAVNEEAAKTSTGAPLENMAGNFGAAAAAVGLAVFVSA